MSVPGGRAAGHFRRQFGRAAYGGVVAGLAGGIFFGLLHQQAASVFVLASTCGLLIALPVVNVVAVLTDEVRRRDWAFVLLASGVLALLAYTLVTRL